MRVIVDANIAFRAISGHGGDIRLALRPPAPEELCAPRFIFGGDKTVKGVRHHNDVQATAEVTLDGSRSGPASQITNYLWKEGDTVLGQGSSAIMVTKSFVEGEHYVTLTITDLQNQTCSDAAHLSVLPAKPYEDGGKSASTPVASWDPNELVGPSGYGRAHFVAGGTVLPYRINFENDSNATAPAQRVTVSQVLDPHLDRTTFQFTSLGFGDKTIEIPAGRQHFQTLVPVTFSAQTFEVQIEAGFNEDSGEIYAVFDSVDPDTNLPPADVLTEFLPPEDGTGRGQGFVTYTVQGDANLATGTAISGVANISFDYQPIISTDQVDPHDAAKGTDPAKRALVTIDANIPSSQIAALPAYETATFNVSWSGHRRHWRKRHRQLHGLCLQRRRSDLHSVADRYTGGLRDLLRSGWQNLQILCRGDEQCGERPAVGFADRGGEHSNADRLGLLALAKL